MAAFQIFGIKIYWYGIFYFISFIVGYIYLSFLAKTYKAKESKSLFDFMKKGVDDLIFFLVLGVLLGGRIGYILFYDFIYYIHNPIKIFYVREGGMSFVGGTIGVILCVFYLQRKYRLNKDDILRVFDMVISFLPFGLMLGRLGNFLNKELYGKIVTDVFPSISTNTINFFHSINIFYVYPNIDNMIRFNSNFYEGFLEGFLLLVILQILFWKFKFKPGALGAIFLVLYGIFRFLVEFVRFSPSKDYVGVLTISQVFMIFYIILGIVLFGYFQKKH